MSCQQLSRSINKVLHCWAERWMQSGTEYAQLDKLRLDPEWYEGLGIDMTSDGKEADSPSELGAPPVMVSASLPCFHSASCPASRQEPLTADSLLSGRCPCDCPPSSGLLPNHLTLPGQGH